MANDIKLGESHPIDGNLRPVKVGGESTSLEVALENARIRGNCEVTGSISTNEIKSDSNHTRFDTSVGFDLLTSAYDVNDTLVNFRSGNKQMVTSDQEILLTLDFTFQIYQVILFFY